MVAVLLEPALGVVEADEPPWRDVPHALDDRRPDPRMVALQRLELAVCCVDLLAREEQPERRVRDRSFERRESEQPSQPRIRRAEERLAVDRLHVDVAALLWCEQREHGTSLRGRPRPHAPSPPPARPATAKRAVGTRGGMHNTRSHARCGQCRWCAAAAPQHNGPAPRFARSLPARPGAEPIAKVRRSLPRLPRGGRPPPRRELALDACSSGAAELAHAPGSLRSSSSATATFRGVGSSMTSPDTPWSTASAEPPHRPATHGMPGRLRFEVHDAEPLGVQAAETVGARHAEHVRGGVVLGQALIGDQTRAA